MWAVGIQMVRSSLHNGLSLCSRMLLDRHSSSSILQDIQSKFESDGDSQIADLHLWHVAPGRLAAMYQPAPISKGKPTNISCASAALAFRMQRLS